MKRYDNESWVSPLHATLTEKLAIKKELEKKKFQVT